MAKFRTVSFWLCLFMPALSQAFQTRLPSRVPTTKPKVVLSLGQYAPEALNLFNNIKTPATILISGLVPMGLTVPLEVKNPNGEEETKFMVVLRRLYSIISILSLLSEFIALTWATVTTNQLIETKIEPAESVWHLLTRDFELAWTGVNTHFLLGLLGFTFLVGTRAFFIAGTGLLGRCTIGMSLSGLCLMLSTMNRGVANGSGSEESGYGNVVKLAVRHFTLMFRNATSKSPKGNLEIVGIVLMTVSLFGALWVAFTKDKPKPEK